MNYYILSLFPEMVLDGLNTSIIGKAVERGLLSIEGINIRDYTLDKHKKVDDYPYGGGAGMLMQAQPVYDAWKSVADRTKTSPRTIYVTPQGRTFNQKLAAELAESEELVFLCGHYEGIDERVLEEIVTDYVSIGDYVLTGGELASMVMIDAISRLVPGVLNNEESAETESFHNHLLEHPQYSRPVEWHGKRVPDVLLSGNQRRIMEWRTEESIRRTRERRTDLYEKYERLQRCREFLQRQKLLHTDMTELIARGQAEYILFEEECVCLRDVRSGAYFFTAKERESGERCLQKLKESCGKIELLVLHQEEMIEPAQRLFELKTSLKCLQAVYTRKEKLPITGLYRLDAETEENGMQIRRLDVSWLDMVCAHYHTMVDRDYVEERLKKGAMYGAFFGEELAGFIGTHQEGSIGLLMVLEPYRRKNVAKALETYLINLQLEQGFTPFGQIVEDNEVSIHLQESLGLYFAKSKVYWLE